MKNTLTLIGAIAVAIAVIAAAAIIVKKYTDKKKKDDARLDDEIFPYGDMDDIDDCCCDDCTWDEVPVEEDDDFGFAIDSDAPAADTKDSEESIF